jgi:hypothetical protein
MNLLQSRRTTIGVVGALVIACLMFLSCSSSPLAGNGSGTSSITGTVYGLDGTPAQGVLVNIYKIDNMPSPSLSKRSSFDSVLTGENGRFAIEVQPNVIYNIIAEKGSNKCLKDSITAVEPSKVFDIGNLFLESAGSLEGRVTLCAGHDPRTVLILVFGTNMFCVPNGSDGAFLLNNMAAGRYAVRFMSTIAGYRTLDTVVTIRKGVRDSLGKTIQLAYTGINKVVIAGAYWDSLLLKAVLSWHPADTTQVHIKGYNVYRGVSQSKLTMIASKISDTCLTIDSLYSLSDPIAFFRINAVLSTDDEGAAGLCTIDVSPRAWKKTAGMPWSGFSNDYYVRFIEAGFNRLFMVNQQAVGILRVADQSNEPLVIVKRPELTDIKGIAVSDTRFYVANAVTKSLKDSGTIELYAFDSSGAFIGKQFEVKMSGQECALITGIKVLDGNNFYFLSDVRVDHRNDSGELLNSWTPPSALASVNTVYGAVRDELLYFHSYDYLTQWQLNVLSPECIVNSTDSLPAVPIDNFAANRGNTTFFSIEKSETENPNAPRYFLSERDLNGSVISRLIVIDQANEGILFCCDERGALYVKDAIHGTVVRYEREKK